MSTSFQRGELPHNGNPVYFVRRKINGKPYLIGQITWIGGGWEFRNRITGRRLKFNTLDEAKDEARHTWTLFQDDDLFAVRDDHEFED